MAILSIRGLYNYDNTIFDGLTLPDGMEKGALLNDLIAELAELEIVYPNAARMKALIRSWSVINYPLWDRAWKALQLEYNPIWNVDGTVTEKETRNLSRSGSSSGTSGNTRTDNLNESVENKVAGFNATTYSNREMTTVSNTGTQKDDGTRAEQHKDTDTGTIEHVTRRTGNIGVTTTQQMLREELEIAKVNLYHLIIDSFKDRFCVMVY